MPRSGVPKTKPNSNPSPNRLEARGKWLWKGGQKHFVRGVTYGPFGGPGGRPKHSTWERDLDLIVELGANTVRVYEVPSVAFLDLCAERGLGVFVGLAWGSHLTFLPPYGDFGSVLESCAVDVFQHPAIDAWIVGNEVPPDIARFLGVGKVQAALEDLVAVVREQAGGALVAYANYPTTEYLNPRNADFVAFNLYLEERDALRSYLARLGVLAGDRPLVVSEFGTDGARGEVLEMFLEECEDGGVAGAVVFAFCDEWFRGGEDVEGWKFGLVDERRERKGAFEKVKESFARKAASRERLPVSVVVCTRNGEATLKACLDSLEKLVPPPLEVIVVDDGSTDSTADTARKAGPLVRLVQQEGAGLSAARNRGAAEAKGEIIAYTDDDCVADPQWLRWLMRAFDEPEVVAAGGPNIPPPPRNVTEAAVARAPGAPSHVLFDDRRAEHIPGCNLAVRKAALTALGGFREHYTTAGDDVDFCWRLLDTGGEIRYVPAAMVWHHRRATAEAYFRQQAGYGRAEAMLYHDHPERFAPGGGGARWGGIVYSDGPVSALPRPGNRIYHGSFGAAPFQFVYAGDRYLLRDIIGMRPARGAVVAPRWLVLWFALAQPFVRGWARWSNTASDAVRKNGGSELPRFPKMAGIPRLFNTSLAFWSEESVAREALLSALLESGYFASEDEISDLECGSKAVQITTATEYHGKGRCLTRARIRGYLPTVIHARRIRKTAHSLGLIDAH